MRNNFWTEGRLGSQDSTSAVRSWHKIVFVELRAVLRKLFWKFPGNSKPFWGSQNSRQISREISLQKIKQKSPELLQGRREKNVKLNYCRAQFLGTFRVMDVCAKCGRSCQQKVGIPVRWWGETLWWASSRCLPRAGAGYLHRCLRCPDLRQARENQLFGAISRDSWRDVLGASLKVKERKKSSDFLQESPRQEKFMNWPFFGLVCRGDSWILRFFGP